MNVNLKYWTLLFAVFLSLSVFSQKEKKIKEKKQKTVLPENIEIFPKNFLVRPRFVYPFIAMNVSNRLFGKGEKFTYMPAMPGVVGLSLKIKKVYVSAAIQLPPGEPLKRKYGVTKFRDININIQTRVIAWGLFYRDYRGFYLNNYKTYYPDWKKDSLGFPKAPNLRTVEAGLNLGFTVNKRFSLNAAFAQGERQKESAGSLILGVSERYQRIEADTGFVPSSQQELHPNLDKLRYGDFITTVFSLGYGYQFVIKNFHFTPVLMLGSGIQVQNYVQTDRRRFLINVPTYASGKVQIGYNGDHFFSNIIYITEFNTIPIKESRIRLFHNWIEVGVGFRL